MTQKSQPMAAQNAWPSELPPGQAIMPQCRSERRACGSVVAREVGAAGRAIVSADVVERVRSTEA